MSDSDQQPSPLPPAAAQSMTGAAPPAMPPVDPAEHVPVAGVAGAVEAILRQPRRVMHQVREGQSRSLIRSLVILTAGCGLIYGLVMGTFSGGMQLWAVPAKIILGLLFSALICLPSLYIFSCLSGSSAGLKHVVCLLAGALALITVLLLGFAPVIWIFSQSTESAFAMGFLHLLVWMVAVGFGMRFLLQGFGGFDSRSHGGLHVWIVIFLLVLLQMSTALRPLIGTSDTLLPVEKKFFMTHWLDHMQGTSRHDQYSME